MIKTIENYMELKKKNYIWKDIITFYTPNKKKKKKNTNAIHNLIHTHTHIYIYIYHHSWHILWEDYYLIFVDYAYTKKYLEI